MKPITLQAFDYIPGDEKESDSPTVFKLKPMSGMMALDMGFVAQENGQPEAIKRILSKCLVGWDNFDAPFDNKNKNKNLEFLSKDVIVELFNAISSKSGLLEDETKN